MGRSEHKNPTLSKSFFKKARPQPKNTSKPLVTLCHAPLLAKREEVAAPADMMSRTSCHAKSASLVQTVFNTPSASSSSANGSGSVSGVVGRHMMARLSPAVANNVTDQLSGCENLVVWLGERCRQLDRHGLVGRPSWVDLKDGAQPPVPASKKPGEWQHGLQHHASSASECNFRETVMTGQSCAADQAHLRSQ